MYLLKRNYVVGFVLLIAFILFVAAGSVGQDAEVIIGTMGFLGIVALLPLFLYLVFADIKSKRESIKAEAVGLKEEEEAKEVAALLKLKAEEVSKKDSARETSQAREIDRDFIEKLRADQIDLHKREGEEPETKRAKEIDEERFEDLDRLDIPKRVDEESESESTKEIDKEPIEDSSRLDIPKRVEKEPEYPRENHEELIEGIKAKQTQAKEEGEKEPIPKVPEKEDESDYPEEGDDAKENET